jgi:hypothetical protein
MATLYFGLIAFLVFGMRASYVETGPALTAAPTRSQAHW